MPRKFLVYGAADELGWGRKEDYAFATVLKQLSRVYWETRAIEAIRDSPPQMDGDSAVALRNQWMWRLAYRLLRPRDIVWEVRRAF